jgi:multidrug efflux pump subunit AcrA (membrane-fusion protein)
MAAGSRSMPRCASSSWLIGAFFLLAVGLAFGASRSYSQQRQVMATAEQIRDFVPSVRVATVQASDATVLVTLPATTSAFSVANMFARASGYIDKRYVDIGDRVKEGQLLAEIVAPELDHQIAQAEATLGQLRAAVEQAQANKNLAQVTWDRDKGLGQVRVLLDKRVGGAVPSRG